MLHSCITACELTQHRLFFLQWLPPSHYFAKGFKYQLEVTAPGRRPYVTTLSPSTVQCEVAFSSSDVIEVRVLTSNDMGACTTEQMTTMPISTKGSLYIDRGDEYIPTSQHYPYISTWIVDLGIYFS